MICLVLTLAPLEHPQANWSPGIHGRPAFWLRDYPKSQQVVWLESGDGGQSYKSRDVIPPNPERGTLLPTLERPAGFNGPPQQLPPLLYFEGLSRYRKPDELIQNDVFFVRFRQ